MSVRSGQSITVLFSTRTWATGAATNATGTPTGTLYVNGVSNAASVTVANVTTGLYTAAVTLPTLAFGDVVELNINATVSGVTDNGIVWCDTKDVALDTSGDVTFNNTSIATVTTVTTTTNLTNLPSIPNNWLTAAGIAAGALNGKGDWLLASSYTAPLSAAGTRSALGMASANLDSQLAALDADVLTRLSASAYTAPPTVAQIATYIYQDTTAGDFTVSTSPGKIIFSQLGGAFTTSSSVFTAASLVNAPTGSGGGNVTIGVGGADSSAFTSNAITILQSGLATTANLSSVSVAANGLDSVLNVTPPTMPSGGVAFKLVDALRWLYRRFFPEGSTATSAATGLLTITGADSTTVASRQVFFSTTNGDTIGSAAP
jgi:hypothetical protein